MTLISHVASELLSLPGDDDFHRIQWDIVQLGDVNGSDSFVQRRSIHVHCRSNRQDETGNFRIDMIVFFDTAIGDRQGGRWTARAKRSDQCLTHTTDIFEAVDTCDGKKKERQDDETMDSQACEHGDHVQTQWPNEITEIVHLQHFGDNEEENADWTVEHGNMYKLHDHFQHRFEKVFQDNGFLLQTTDEDAKDNAEKK